ncbi:MAG: hypothetical protein KJ734_08265 [Chloroflexi bacterium]|nr:hypothetical protein [Chloroflexota bacterium]
MTTQQDQLLATIRDEAANPLDRAAALHRLQELTGWVQGELAARAGFSPRRVRELLSLRHLAPVIQEGIRAGWLTTAHVRVLRRLESEEQAHWCQVVRTESLSAATLQRRVGRPAPTGEALDELVEPDNPAADTRGAAEPLPSAPPVPTSPPVIVPAAHAEPALAARDQRRLAQLLAAYPHLPQPSAEAMIRFVGGSPFGQQVLGPLETALAHLPDNLDALTGSQGMTLVALLDPLLARLAAVRDMVQANLGGTPR